jgi:N-acyl-D-amino-acid deacylase
MVTHPLFMLETDAMNSTLTGPLAEATRHPLSYSGQLYFLTHYVAGARCLSLEEAIRKMTSMPAGHFGLSDRGLVARGYFGDICVFDESSLWVQADPSRPPAYAEGMRYVLVNGELVLDGTLPTDARPGRTLLRR